MVEADSRLIEWLFHESGVTSYRISKDVGIAESTISRIKNKVTPMDAIQFGYASRLTEYARIVQLESKSDKKPPIEPDTDSTSEGGDEP